MKKSGYFNSNSANVGGRQIVIEEMLNHVQRLNRISSQPSNLRVEMGKSPKKSPKRKGKKHAGKSNSSTLLLRKNAMSAPPESYHLMQTLNENRNAKRATSYEEAEHEARQRAMNRRIREYPDRNQRKQNAFDMSANPSRFIRPAAEYTYDFLYGLPPHRRTLLADPHDKHGLKSPLQKGHHRRTKTEGKKINNNSTPSTSKNKSKKKRTHSEKKTFTDPYEQLRHRLLDVIVENRIYKEKNLERLFVKAAAMNSHLDPDRLQAVIMELREELIMNRPPV